MNNSQVKRESRIIEFDIIKFIAIFLVICGHSILHLSSDNRYDNSLFLFISSFHMPLFMLISGYFSERSINLPFKEVFKRKFFQLLYPAISFGIIFLITDILFFSFKPSDSGSFLFEVLWFLKSAFCCFFITFFCIKISRNKLLGSIIAIVISQIIPIFKINWMLPFFVIGYMANIRINIDKFKEKSSYIFLCSLTIFIILLIFLNKDVLSGDSLKTIKQNLLKGDLTVITEWIYIQVYRCLIGFTGSLTVIGLIFTIFRFYQFKLSEEFKRISNYGKETLGIYIMQTLLLEIIISNIVDLKALDKLLFTYLIVPLVSYALMDFCVVIIEFIHKNDVLRRILFQPNEKRRKQ